MAVRSPFRFPSVRAWLDASAYAIAVTVGVFVLAAIATVLTGGDGARLNLLLFLSGWLLLTYATFRLWPSSPPEDDETEGYAEALPDVHETRLQRLTRQLPPFRWIKLPPPERRISVSGQQFLASVVVLATSFLLETLAGVG